MKKYILFITNLFVFVLFLFNNAFAYKEEVHENINLESVRYSNLDFFLTYKLNIAKGYDEFLNIGQNKKKIYDWIAYGGIFEDSGARWLNHFHDPLEEWAEAGLWGISPSSILWATEIGVGNACSWDSARQYYYTYLTGKDFVGNIVADSQAEKEAYFARCLRSVGQVMHLLQDASVPLHTRDDAHVLPVFFSGEVITGTYETYTNSNRKNLDYVPDQTGNLPDPMLLTNPQPEANFSHLPPITGLFDRNQYNSGDAIPPANAAIGLAEYSNANFLTQDTIWEYPHPVLSDLDYNPDVWLNPEEVDAEDGIKDNRIYFGKSIGEPVQHLVAAAYWYYQLYMWNKPELYYAFILDEKCFGDYAAKLVPRAVGYSAELLDYFFRGNIEISIPRQGFYALTSGPAQGFNQVKLRVKNTTPNNEEMNNGSIELVVKYRLSQGDPFTSNYANTTWEFFYITAPEANSISSIPRNDFVELTFDLNQNPIPLWATDVYLQVVYRGQLGNEHDAVAVGFKDISEPTFIDLFNNFDKICLFGNWANSGDEAVSIIDNPANGGNGDGIADEWDVYPHNLKDTYYLLWPDWWVGGVTSPNPEQDIYNYHIPLVAPGDMHRGPYVLTNYTFIFTFLTSSDPTDPDDDYGHVIKGGLSIKNAIKNQIEWSYFHGYYIRYLPVFSVFRGKETRAFNVIYPLAYPGPDHPCSFWDLE